MAEITKVALKVDNNNSFPNNNAGAITPAILRAFNVNMIDSMVDEILEFIKLVKTKKPEFQKNSGFNMK